MGKVTIGSATVLFITCPAADGVLKIAAEELQKYLAAVVGETLPVIPDAQGEGGFFLETGTIPSAGERYDVCVLEGRDGAVHMTGESSLAAFFGVYDFLQEFCGVRFWAARHETVPSLPWLALPEAFRREYYSEMAIRSWVNRTNDPEVLKFLVKSRINTVLGCGGWHPSLSSEYESAENAAMVRRLGLKLRGPGHCWRLFIPDEALFDDHPEYFPLHNGKREPNGRTACFSNPETQKIFFGKLRDYLKQHPYWDIFSFWAEDVYTDFYCECPECRKKSTSDWYVTLVNGAAKILDELYPNALFEFISYNITRFAPSKSATLYKNGQKMLLNFCQGQHRNLYLPLEERCDGNDEMRQRFNEWQEYLDAVHYEGIQMDMEYYNTCEWPSQNPAGRAWLWPLDVLQRDIAFFYRRNIRGIGGFTGIDVACWPAPVFMWTWLKLRSHPATSLQQLKREFFNGYFGDAWAAKAQEHLELLTQMMTETTSPDNLSRLKNHMRDIALCRCEDAPYATRLAVLRRHCEYCILLKEVHLAFLHGNDDGWKGRQNELYGFFERHRSELEPMLKPFPPLWMDNWFRWLERGNG